MHDKIEGSKRMGRQGKIKQMKKIKQMIGIFLADLCYYNIDNSKWKPVEAV